MKVLFVTARFPYPPIKGDKVIPYQRLKHLSRKHKITLLSLTDRRIAPEHLAVIHKYCERVLLVPLYKAESLANVLVKGLSNTPLQVLYFESQRFKMRLGDLLREGQYDLVHTFMLRMAPYISDYKGFPKIIELIDSMELNMKRRASLEKNPKKWIFNLESRRLSVYEKIMVKKFDCAIVVSQFDKKLIGQDNIVVNPLGVDTEIFHPMKSVKKYPYLIIFSGNMGYFPNEKAVLYFVNDIFPQVQEKIPKAKFQVAGGGASHIIKQLEKKNRAIKILGFVDSMSYYINRASVSVGPMTAGSGMQFKILEALACGVPVVATSLAQGDIELNEGDGLFIADDPAVFADRVVRIIEDKRLQNVIAKTGPQAIREKKYSWERSNLVVENIYSGLTNLKR